MALSLFTKAALVDHILMPGVKFSNSVNFFHFSLNNIIDGDASTICTPDIHNTNDWVMALFPVDVEVFTIFLLFSCVSCNPTMSFDIYAGTTLCGTDIVPDGVFTCPSPVTTNKL